MPYTDQEKAQFCEDLLSGKIHVYCGLHAYFGPNAQGEGAPVQGCPQCWKVWWLKHFSTTPREKLAEEIEKTYEAMVNTVNFVEHGNFDFRPYLHPDVKIEPEN
jgi:hypothetical protein